jgi:hypothetical protein
LEKELAKESVTAWATVSAKGSEKELEKESVKEWARAWE